MAMKPQPGRLEFVEQPLDRDQQRRHGEEQRRDQKTAQHQVVALVVFERHGVELEPVIDQFVAELARDFGLQALDFLRLEFDHLAAAQIDQMVVMGFGRGFVARAAFAEIVPLDDAGILEQAHGAVDGRNRDAVVDLGAAPVKLLDVGMIVGAPPARAR